MAIDNLQNKLNALTSGNVSNWEAKAKKRLANKSWLKYSRKIALKINVFLKENKIKQKELAEMLSVSPQQVSKIIKGRENLTLETIAKIEDCLHISLLDLDKPQKIQIVNFSGAMNYEKSTYKSSDFKMGKVIKHDFTQDMLQKAQ